MGYEEEKEIGQDTAGADRAKTVAEMEDDGLDTDQLLIHFMEHKGGLIHRSGDRSQRLVRKRQRGGYRHQPGSNQESRNQEKTRTMNRSDYADPVKLKARRKGSGR